jgi:multidrug efflux pump subunit AcrA (membrane-fusion protein)
MKRIDRRIVIIASLVFIVGLSYGIMKFLIAQKEDPPVIRAMNTERYVRAEIVEYRSILSPVSEPGRMSSISEVNLSAEASGKIEQGDIMLKKGATFKKGDVLFQIYRDEMALALKAKKSQFQNTLALLLPDIAIDFPEDEVSFRKFFSSIDVDKSLPAFPDVNSEQLTIFLAGRNVMSEYYSIRKDELQLSRHVSRAAFNGTLSEVYMEVGAFTNTGGTVARAIQTDELELEVPLSRADAMWVRIGDPVSVHSDQYSIDWKGVVIRKSQVVDEKTQSQHAYVKIKKSDPQTLLAGEFLTASFPGRPIDNVMEIPRNAVFNTNEVFLIEDRRLIKHTINIIKVNPNTLLFNGPEPGDTIVTQALINVFEGTRVTTSLESANKSNEIMPSGKK